MDLPDALNQWFDTRGWVPHPHQRAMVAQARAPALLLIAPTGGGKTLAGFLPTLAELLAQPHSGLHTLYISPLKALAADIKRNLRRPIEDLGLQIRIEDRTGDTPQSRRKAQRKDPPHILLTTPESLALLISYEDAPRIFAGLRRVVIDEIHALAESKRGDQLMLALSHVQRLAPNMRRVGLSATVDDPAAIGAYLAPHPDRCKILEADPGPTPDIAMLEVAQEPPWAGGGGRYAIQSVLKEIERHRTTLIFHNTRAQAELFFHDLWLANQNDLPIGIHHGALSKDARHRVETAMVNGELRAVVCTGSLDLGIDWGDVDLVLQIGAPKNVKRLVQRIGRANHNYNTPSKARLVPANRFEILECHAALEAVHENTLDGEPRGPGPRDVLCQHILLLACAGPIVPDDLYAQVKRCGAYRDLTRAAFEACLEFIATGGYALRAYDRWQRLKKRPDGAWVLRDPRTAQRIRMNIGTILSAETLKVKWRGRGGAALGEIEEAFAATLTPGDTFLMAGHVVRYERLNEMTIEVSRNTHKTPKIAGYYGHKFSTSFQLSERILDIMAREDWSTLPSSIVDWLTVQKQVSQLPRPGRLLVESFPRETREHLVVYGFAGINAQQTLGLLLTQRMEAANLGPMGFVANDYATLIWGLDPVEDAALLFDRQGIQQSLETWLDGNQVMKRTFRGAALIAGLIERNIPGLRKSGRQATFSSDILFDTLRRYDPDHLMLQITREEAMRGLVDFGRIAKMLDRIDGQIDTIRLSSVTPLAAPLFLEPGRIPVKGLGEQRLLAEEASRLMQEAGLAPIT